MAQNTAPQPSAASPAAPPALPESWLRERSSPLCPPAAATVAECFYRQALRSPDTLIMADATPRFWSFRDALLSVHALSRKLRREPGKHLAIMLPASPQVALCYLAALFAGKIPVMINWSTGRRNIEASMLFLGIRRILTARALTRKIQDLGLESLLPNCFFLEDLASPPGPLARRAAQALLRLFPRLFRPRGVADTAVILFTSGSENTPKAVPLSHENILANIRDFYDLLRFMDSDRMIGILPPFHSFGLTVTILLPLCLGLRTVYHPSPMETKTIARMIEQFRVTVLIGTPTFLSGIIRASARIEMLSSLRITVSGAEHLPESLAELVRTKLPGMKLLEGYGVTECSPVISVNPVDSPVPGSIGRLQPSLEMRIVHPDTGVPVPTGHPGILLVRGPSVFSGYLNPDAANPFVELEGKRWYRTGDMVRCEANGRLFFCGRLRRFVKMGGEMISLPAIEQVLEPHFVDTSRPGPFLAVAATEALPPVITLFTVAPADRTQVNQFIRQGGLSPLHHIKKHIQLDAIPMLGNGKTDYQKLKALLAASPD